MLACTKAHDDFVALHAMRAQQEKERKEAERVRQDKEAAAAIDRAAATVAVKPQEAPSVMPAAANEPSRVEDKRSALLIIEFISLQSCSPADKKVMRATIEKWETYRQKMTAIA